MKPSFALSLTFDGIRLLHRAAGGWRIVGDVALDAQDMGAELAVLRKTATGLEPAGVRTKVLLPNEQIKYLSIDTVGMTVAARRDAAKAALDGATPYAVDDLAFDISADGDVTHIAAVAKETLAEAEGFAQDHRLNPVSFAAIPGDQAYLGEPYFGPTAASADILEAGETVEPDGIAVVVIGDIVTPDGPVATDETEVEAAAAEPPQDAETETSEPALEAKPDVVRPEIPTAATQIEVPVEPPAETIAPQEATALASVKTTPPETTPPPAIGFASRRAPDAAKTAPLEGVRRANPPTPEGSVTAGHIDIEPDSTSLAPTNATPSAKAGFLSRRKGKPKAANTAPTPGKATSRSEKESMTIFGARKKDVGGKPRFLGLILTAALLVFLAGVAAWASVFLDNGISLSRLFGDRTSKTEVTEVEADISKPQQEIVVASLDLDLTEEDVAVLDALSEPQKPEPSVDLSDTAVEAIYAVTGIWPLAPDVPPEPVGLINIEDLYLTSIDPVSTSTDAVALPAAPSFETDVALSSIASPAAAGTAFELDARGLVIPTPEGALSPEGFTVYLGRPEWVPPATPTRFQVEPEDTAVRSALAGRRPQPRPADLVEKTERAQLDGLTRSELSGYRPALRPLSLQQQAESETIEPEIEAASISTDGAVALALAGPSAIDNATRLAVRASRRPDVRPANFSRIVKKAQRTAPQDEVRVASAAAVAPRVVQPKIPSKTSVAKQATVRNAINLRKVNLIGVYGKPSSRRALVRLGNGRYRKVVVGDKIDGGRVSAIGESELRYVKRGRNVVLKMPR
jgi:hypothetical protein